MLCGCHAKGSGDAVKGFLDLSSEDFTGNRIVYLDGEWEFYWKRLFTPKDFAAQLPTTTGYFVIPGYWNGHRVDGTPLSGDGYATFRLRVKIRPGTKDLSLRIEEEASAYRLWVNGSPVMANGRTGPDADASRPYKKISIAEVPAGTDTLDCILQVSNFNLANGGPYRKIALGSTEAVNKLQARLLAFDVFLFGMLGVIGVYHLVFYLLTRKEPSLVYFAFFCLFWCLGIPFGATSGKFVTLIFPNCPWYLVSRMELLTWFPTVPLFLMFFASLYPKEFHAPATRFVQVAGGIFFILALCLPSRLIGLAETPFSIFSLAIIVYISHRLFCAVRRKRNSSLLMLTGFLFFVGTVINDILYMAMIIYSLYLVSVGIAVMILIQSFALARRFAMSFAAEEALSAELEEKNTALSQLDRLKDEFLAHTSHELRTPLNGIIGIAESLQSGITGTLPVATQQNLSMIVASGKRLAGLINDILDFSRLKNRDIQLHRQPVDMRSLAGTVLAVMKPLADGKDILLVNDIPENLAPVWGDENRLQQILYNLIGNAIKFTDSGQIRITGEKNGNLVEVSVMDSGTGIPEDRLEFIFQPFEQADASDARAYGGAGLGLSITRQLVELHDGTITVRSKPGKGSVFRFTLPVSSAGLAGSPHPGTAAAPLPGPEPVRMGGNKPLENLPGLETNITILAVDDDPVNLQVVSNHLAFGNVSVVTVPSGRQAVRRITDGLLPDLVLLDIMMPTMTGFEVLQWVRQRYTSSELPVIMLTAKGGSDNVAAGFDLGANDYLVKPFARGELLGRIVSHLKLKEAYLTLRENLSLRKELDERKRIERELRLVQQRLSLILDHVDEALLAVNQDEEITFCNRKCETLLGCKSDDLLGKPFLHIVQATDSSSSSRAEADALRSCLHGNLRSNLIAALKAADGGVCMVRMHFSAFEMEEESICLLILRKNGEPAEQAATVEIERSLGVIETLNQNRTRLESIKSTLNGLLPLIDSEHPELLKEIQSIDEVLNNSGSTPASGDSRPAKHHLAVEIMNGALEYWTETTGLPKADLAHHSGQWKVYINQDGWRRTQTLDKYLNRDALPQRPQWAKIIRTAEFVLASSDKPSPGRKKLEALVTKLRAYG